MRVRSSATPWACSSCQRLPWAARQRVQRSSGFSGSGRRANTFGCRPSPRHAAIVRMWWEELEWADTAFRFVELGRERGDEAFLPYVYVLAAQNDCSGATSSAPASTPTQAVRSPSRSDRRRSSATHSQWMRSAGAPRPRRRGAREGERALELARRTHGTPIAPLASWGVGSSSRSAGPRRRRSGSNRWSSSREQEICEPSPTRFALDYVHALIELERLRRPRRSAPGTRPMRRGSAVGAPSHPPRAALGFSPPRAETSTRRSRSSSAHSPITTASRCRSSRRGRCWRSARCDDEPGSGAWLESRLNGHKRSSRSSARRSGRGKPAPSCPGSAGGPLTPAV